ncbi:hypothetical protein MTR67_037602 [Solanum verrucosum]|uniref:AT-hook motif nuclear-localized protein n=1 Tax=Solanum verrucosum TaxID=315347 RepID=A0AAF0UDY4_SOLVR|nr:hypothetical protein MTR67_037602 [Solanum verrucosum]
MKKKRGNDSSANDFIWVLGLRAPPPKKMMPVNVVLAEKKPEETHRDFLTIDQGQDIREEVLTYFQNSTNNSENSYGHRRMGSILSATGSVLHPNSNEGSYKINYLLGRFIIFEDGQVQQHESWTISCFGSSSLVITDEVNGRLIAAEPVQVIVGTFPINSST